MKLLLAASADGFLCKGLDDDMKWTGPNDKAVFKLLTLADGMPLLAGSRTKKMLPTLPHRKVFGISHIGGMNLEQAQLTFPDSYLIGGPTIAMAAIEAGFIHHTVICQGGVGIHEGIRLFPLMKALGLPDPVTVFWHCEVEVSVYETERHLVK